MTTGRLVLERVLILFGYTGMDGRPDEVRDAALFKKGEAAVRQIYDELRRIDRMGGDSPLESMEQELVLSPAAIRDVMPYGVAMLLAQNEGDGDCQTLFSALYSRKRSSVPQRKRSVSDVLPKGGY